jgi:hypothetical protein
LANQKQGAAGISYLLHSSLAGAQLCCAFTSLSKVRKYGTGCSDEETSTYAGLAQENKLYYSLKSFKHT